MQLLLLLLLLQLLVQLVQFLFLFIFFFQIQKWTCIRLSKAKCIHQLYTSLDLYSLFCFTFFVSQSLAHSLSHLLTHLLTRLSFNFKKHWPKALKGLRYMFNLCSNRQTFSRLQYVVDTWSTHPLSFFFKILICLHSPLSCFLSFCLSLSLSLPPSLLILPYFSLSNLYIKYM